MHTLSQEFLALCRQLGEAQTRSSEVVAEQAAELERLQREVVRLRAAVIVRDTRLEQAHAALEDARQAQPPGLPLRKEMARHIRMLAERVATLSRECLRWRLQAAVQEVSEPAAHPMPAHQPPHALDESLAAADLVICQTGCISHDDYWRVQDHCRRTGKPCILVDQAALPSAAQGTGQPVVVLRLAGGGRSALPHAMLHAVQD